MQWQSSHPQRGGPGGAPGSVPPGLVGLPPIGGLPPLCLTQGAGDGVGYVPAPTRPWLGETWLAAIPPTGRFLPGCLVT